MYKPNEAFLNWYYIVPQYGYVREFVISHPNSRNHAGLVEYHKQSSLCEEPIAPAQGLKADRCIESCSPSRLPARQTVFAF